MAGILFVRASLPDENTYLNTHGASRVARAIAVGYDCIDVNTNVNWDTVEPYMQASNFDLFFFSGHGSDNVMQGDAMTLEAQIMSSSNMVKVAYMNGKAVYSLACNTGSSLLYHLYDNGAVAVAGFVGPIRMKMSELPPPLDDIKYVSTSAGCFKFLEAIIDGRTWYEAHNDAVAEWLIQYNYWVSGDGADDFGALDCAAAILEQKNNFMTWPTSSEYVLPSPSADTGTITVTTDNADATFTVTGPATYSGTGTSWTKANAPVGDYTIAYDDVSGYVTPSDETLTLTVGATIAFTASYAAMPTDGTIVVNTNVSNSIFTVTGATKTYFGTGSTWTTTAPAGDYTVSWGPVAGYTAPANQTLTVTAGLTTTFTGVYVAAAATGTLSVVTNNASATFTLTGPSTYSGSGTSWSQSGAPVGSYTIAYGAVAGYVTPQSETQTLYSGTTIVFNGIYSTESVETGTIFVFTNSASASFNIVGPEVYSGTGTDKAFYSVPVGSYTITYGAIAGYTAPSPETLVLAADSLITFTGNYVAIVGDGTITVTCNISGASFTISGPEVFYGSGSSWSTTTATPGSYTIVYANVAGYITPSNQTKTVSAGQITNFTGTYSAIAGDDGSIYVTTNNAAALFTVVGPETFSGSGTSWSTHTATPGFYTVYFYGIAGYTSPSSVSGTLSSGGVLSLVGYYTASVVPGGITVTTNLAGAIFTISGPDSMSGTGTSWSDSDVTPGDYTITYYNIAGYTTPSPETKAVAAGATTTFTGTYVALATVGTIVVNTNVSASFTLTGPTTYTGTGTSTTQTNAPIGTYTIAYSNVSGYSTPPNESQTLTTGGTITFTGTYAALSQSGTITVTTNNPSAGFTITGANIYSGSGRTATFTSVPVGNYTIVFDGIAGYSTPVTQSVYLTNGGSIAFNGLYTALSNVSPTEYDGLIGVGSGNRFSPDFLVDTVGDAKHFYRVEDSPMDMMFAKIPCLPPLPIDAHILILTFNSAYDVNATNVWQMDFVGTAGTALAVQNERGGIAKFINGGNDNDMYSYFTKKEIVKLESGKGMWFRSAVRIKDVDEADWFFGLCARLTTGAYVFDSRVDAIGFYGTDGSSGINIECRKDSVATQSTAIDTLTDNTFAILDIYVQGTVRAVFYVNGLYKGQILTNLPDNEEMCIAFGCRNGKREANEFSLHQIKVIQDI